MRSIFSRFRYRSWILAAFTIVALLALTITAFRFFLLEPELEKRIRQAVRARSGDLYTIDFKTTDVSLLSGSLHFYQLRLEPNVALWQRRHKARTGKLPPLLVQLQARKLSISGLNYLGLLRGKVLTLDQVQLAAPKLVFLQMKKDTSQALPHQKLQGFLKTVRIKRLNLEVDTLLYKKPGRKAATLALERVDLELRDFQLDSLGYVQPDRFYYSRQLRFTAARAAWIFPRGDYRLQARQVTVHTGEGKIKGKDIRLVPLSSAAAMARRKKNAVTRLQIHIPAAEAQQVDFPALSRHSALTIGQLTIHQPRLHLFKDAQNFPLTLQKPLLHELARSLPTPVRIKQAQIRDMALRYEELAPKAQGKGFVTLKRVQVNISNIANTPPHMAANKPMVIRGSLALMGQLPVKVIIRVNLLDPRGHHTLQGSIGKGQLAVLNPLLEPGYLVRVKSGTLHQGYFRMSLNQEKATGTLRLTYDDFKVDLLSRDPEKESPAGRPRQSRAKKLLSAFTNKVVFNTDNMPGNGRYKNGTINTYRRKTRSLFGFWVDGLVSGTRSTLGLPSQVPPG